MFAFVFVFVLVLVLSLPSFSCLCLAFVFLVFVFVLSFFLSCLVIFGRLGDRFGSSSGSFWASWGVLEHHFGHLGWS